MTSRLAWRLAFSRDPRQRWRQVSVIATASLSTVLILLGIGIVHAAHSSDSRIQARSPVWAQASSDSAVFASLRGLQLGDYQFPTVWLEPAPGHESDVAIVPPGLNRLPAPGEGVLSPGLARRGLTAEDFGLRSSTAGEGPDGTIGLEGLSTSSEGWLYARPAAGRTLGEGGALLSLQGYGVEGSRADMEASREMPSGEAGLLGFAWLILGPALLLLWSGARSLSAIREERAGILLKLGVSPARIRQVLAIETAFLGTAGALPALLVWFGWLSHQRSLFLTGTVLHPGALAFPHWQAAVAAAVTVATAAGAASAGPIRGRTQDRKTSRVGTWQAAPLMISVAMMAGSRWAAPSSSLGPIMLFTGLLATFAALPMALPVAVSRLGIALGSLRRPWMWLAGRRLALRSANLSRPAAAVGLLVFLAGGAFALYGRMMTVEAEPTSEVPLTRFVVDWRDGRPGDLAQLGDEVAGLRVVPTADVESSDPKAIFSTCTRAGEAVTPLDVSACTDRQAVSDEFATSFRELTGFTPVTAQEASGEPGQVLLLGAQRATPLDVMEETADSLPAVSVTQLGAPSTPPTRVGWLVAGWVLATVTLSLALIREVGDRVLASLQDDSHLRRLGLSQREITRTQRWTVIPPVAVAIPLGYVAAVAFALMGYQLGFTIGSIARISVVAGAVALIAATALGVAFSLHRRIVTEQAP